MNNNYGYPNNSNEFDYGEFLEALGIDMPNIGVTTSDLNENSMANDISNSNNNQLFGSYEGYIKGNLFKNLYDEYKNYKPIRLPVNSEKMESLLNLNQMHFVMHEMNLYLDVFPNDVNAMRNFAKYRSGYNKLLNEYESKYGPLNVCDENLNNVPFGWENDKFPWEGGNN